MELFDRAATFPGRPRERVVAIGEAEEVYFRLYPHHYRALQTIRVASQLGRLSGVGDDALVRCESRLIALLMRIILDGLQCGDLRLRDYQRPTEVAFPLWALAFGTRALMDTHVATRQLGIDDGWRVAGDATELLLDALEWAPLSADWDYSRTRERIRSELFANEWAQVPAGPVSRSAG